MVNVYACLAGDWINLSTDSTCTIGENHKSPGVWYEENAEIWAPLERERKDTYYQLNYVHISYHGKDYRINPIFIQIVSE